MKRMALATFLLPVVLTMNSASQVAPQHASPGKFRASSELVLVPVVIHKNGAHVSGLTKEDFVLLSDGARQEIAVFEEIHAALPAAKSANNSMEFTNSRTTRNAERLTIIAIDLVNTASLDQAYLKQEMLKFLNDASQSNEPVALIAITTAGIHVLQDFTTDRTIIASAVRKTGAVPNGREPGQTGTTFLDQTPCALSNSGCGGGSGDTVKQAMRDLAAWEDLYKNAEPYEIFRDRNSRLDTLSTLQQIAQWLSGFPGRKTLVWAGSGIQWFGGMTRTMVGFARTMDYTTFDTRYAGQAADANYYTFRVLSAANVAVYPVDARHGANTSFAMYDVSRPDAPIGDGAFAAQKGRVQNDDQERITMFQQIAATTGGKPCFNRTDLANCLKESAADSHDYYMLGFYVGKATKPGWHTIALKSDQKADLRFRNGFIFSSQDPEKARLTDLQLAMISPLPYTALEISGRFAQMEEKGGKKTAHFELDLPPQALYLGEQNDKLNFDVVVVARGTDGKEVAKFAQRIDKKLQPQQAEVIRSQGLHYTNKLDLPPGDYGVWFVIRDNVGGRTGSVTTTLVIK